MDFRKCKAWQKADDLALAVYVATNRFPKDEVYGLTSQMRRAAVSVAANIAEGSGRESTKDYLRFLYVARGSQRELEYYIHLTQRLGYLPEPTSLELCSALGEAAATLHGLIAHWQRKDRGA